MQKITDIVQLKDTINKNGEMIISKDSDNIIIMNIDEYKNEMLKKEIAKHLRKAEEDIKNGRVMDAMGVFKKWKGEYEIQNKADKRIF